MIIGVSGKINSGKDLVGDIIRFLTSDNYTPLKYNIDYSLLDSFKDFQAYTIIDYKHGWNIKKFADKLKDIVCLLIGCTRAQLEDREFKNKPLNKVWWNFNLGGGKRNIVPYTDEYPTSDRKIMEGRFKEVMTPRLMLQLLGTEAGREIIHSNIWVNSLMSDYFDIPKQEWFETQGVNNMLDLKVNKPEIYKKLKLAYFENLSNWIITDTRFINEAEAIKSKGGILIRINRPCKECGGVGNHKLDCGIGRLEHSSETGLDNYKGFDYIIDNVATITDLIIMVEKILIKEQIIDERV